MMKLRLGRHLFSKMAVATVCLGLLRAMLPSLLPHGSLASQAVAAPQANEPKPAANPSRLSQIVPGVYLYQDTCNVYAIVKGDEAVLIDFGSGEILSELPSIGVRKVSWILHTHFHRDQAQGDALAKARGIKIAAGTGAKVFRGRRDALEREEGPRPL